MESRGYPYSAVERAMKVQEVILRASDGRVKGSQAAEILGISDRQMRRWKQRDERWGSEGLFDRRRHQPSPKRVPLETVRQVLTLYRERDPPLLHLGEDRLADGWARGLGGAARPSSEGPVIGRPSPAGCCRGCSCMRMPAPMPGFRGWRGGLT